MRVYYFAVRFPVLFQEIINMQNLIVDETETEIKENVSVIRMLYRLERRLSCNKNDKDFMTPKDVLAELNLTLAALEVEGAVLSQELQVMLQLCKQIFGKIIDFQITALTEESFHQNVRKYIKSIRQEYWLAWLEDYYCCKLASAFLATVTSLGDDDHKKLFISVLPEFSFSDIFFLDLEPFYKEVMLKFLHGQLPKDLYRSAVPLLTFQQLSSRFKSSTCSLLIFPGTILWKEFGKIYNTAPVFNDFQCIYVWEKQTISSDDGKSFLEQHRHFRPFDGSANSIESGGSVPVPYQAGNLTVSMLANLNILSINPIFSITIWDRKISFALSICKDMGHPQIIGNQTADIHIMIASGLNVVHEVLVKNICARSLFLYCDGRKTKIGMCRLGDKDLWTCAKELICWSNIDLGAMDNRFLKQQNEDIVEGIFIAENVEEI